MGGADIRSGSSVPALVHRRSAYADRLDSSRGNEALSQLQNSKINNQCTARRCVELTFFDGL